MRQFKRFCAATLLSLAIGITAFAGDVQAPAGPSPEPVPVVAPVTTPTPGDVAANTGLPTDILAQLTFELYAQLLSIF